MISANLKRIKDRLPQGVRLVAVSKFHPAEAVLEAYEAGQHLFGESRPQEFEAKALALPKDIEWHFIGHLQTNKLKKVLPYATMVESVDSLHLLEAISRWGVDNGRCVDILLELHLGAEETKQGFSEDEIAAIVAERSRYPGITIRGLMGMATNTSDESIITADFERIASLWRRLRASNPSLSGTFTELSIGMSSDWPLAINAGSTIVRIGTAIFGDRL